MENIIRDNQIDPITANLVRHIKGCRPSTNIAMGWNKWRKSLKHFTMPLNLTNRAVRGHSRHCLGNTYAELVDVLPESQTYPWDMTFHLSPFGDSGLSQVPYWKYIKIYYTDIHYDWRQYNAGTHEMPTMIKENIPFAIWGRDGRVRLASSKMKEKGKIMNLKHRLNALFGLSWRRTRRDSRRGQRTILFSYERRKLQYSIPEIGTEYWDSMGYLPVVDGDIYDVKTGEFHSRLLAGEPAMRDFMSDICPMASISSDLRGQFRNAPSNPSIRSAIRAQINEVLPSTVQDEQSLDAFFRQRRTVISESGVFAL